MSDHPDPERMKALTERLEAARKTRTPVQTRGGDYSAASQGWRMVIELVSGIAIGFGIGYGLDWLLGTLPVFLVLFVLLGFAAGVKTMLRTAQEIERARQAEMSAGHEGD